MFGRQASMTMKLNPQYVQNGRQTARICAALVLLIGGVVVLGWALGLESLKSIITGLATMKANTAIAFMFSGAALWLGAHADPTPTQVRLMRSFAGAIVALGLLTLGEYIAGTNFGIDQVLFADLQTPVASFPGRMSINTALNFSMLGAGLFCLHSRWKRSLAVTQTLTLLAYAIAAVALVGYIYDVRALYRVGPYSSMALNTSICFCLLASGILCAQPEQGLMGLLLSESIGGRTLRRFLPVIAGVPLVLSLLVLLGDRLALYDLNFGLAVMVILNVSFLGVALWVGSMWLNRVDDERRLADEALGESEEKYQAFFENSLDAILLTSPDGSIMAANPAACQIFGRTEAEICALGRGGLVDTSDPRLGSLLVERTRTGKAFGELRMLRNDGSPFPVELSSALFQDRQGNSRTSMIIRDITERKRVEEELHEQEQLFSRMFSSSPVAISMASMPGGKNIEVNEAWCKLTGFSRDETIGYDTAELKIFDPEERNKLARAFSNLGHSRLVESVITTKSGEQKNILLSSDLITINDRQLIIASAIDITERKRAEERVRYQASLLANINDAIIASSVDSRIKAWNSAAEFMYGWKAEEVLGKLTTEIVKTTFEGTDRAEVIRVLAETGTWRGEITQARKDGARFYAETISVALRDAQGKVTDYVSVNRDITERKEAEEKIQRQNRRLSVLREIDTAILAADSVEDIVGRALSHTRALIDCRRAAVALFDWETNEALMFDVKASGASSIPKGMHVSLRPFQDLIRGLSENQAVLFNDLTALPAPPPQFQAQIRDGIRSVCFLSLFSQSILIGSFSMASEIPGYFDEEKISLGREVANQVALAITQKNLLEGLRDQQARVAGIINSAMDAIVSIDAEQRIVLFNPAAEAMFQCEQAEVMGQPLERLLPERFRERHSKHIQQFAQTGVTSRAMGALGTIHGLRRTGEEFPIEASISQTQVGGKSLFTVILRDVTARQRAEEALRQSQENFVKAFNANPAAITITRLGDGRFLNVNPAYLRIMGYEPEEILEHTAEKNIYAYPEERAGLIQQLQADGSVQNHELRVRVKSGEIRNIILSMQPILYNEEDCILTVFIDISDRKKMEVELQRSNRELEQFAYVASHDLQEPLRAVAGMVQLLGQRYKGKLDERADEYINHAVEAAGRMQNLINDLLDYSRVDRLGKPFVSTDLERSLDLALANLQLAIRESHAEITRDALPTVTADPGQLTQVFQNLIGNAIKFRGERTPQIHVSAEKLENGWRFGVRDNGIGIEPQYFERVFLVFQRLHTRREYPGTGIGLSLCKKIVERHQGEIWVESEPEKGSTFYFTIPERSS